MAWWFDALTWVANAYLKNNQLPVISPIEQAEFYNGKTAEKDYYQLQMLLGVDPRETAWCAAFVTAIEVKCGRTGTHDLMAKSYLSYGIEATSPIPGDIAVFDWGNPDANEGHVTFFVSQDANNVYCLGGNQDSMVKYKTYSKKHLLSIRHPY